MKVLKIISKVLLIVVFIVSILLNVFTFRSSYGTLILKYNESKFYSLVGARQLEYTTIYFLDNANEGIQIKLQSNEDGKIEKYYYDFHFDKRSNMTAKVTKIDSAGNKTSSYYVTNHVYREVNDSKVKQEVNESEFVSDAIENIFNCLSLLLADILTSKTKAKIDFSTSPFYCLGIKYELKNNMTFHFDLNGKLRKITIKQENNSSSTYTINYKNKAINLPNLERYA